VQRPYYFKKEINGNKAIKLDELYRKHTRSETKELNNHRSLSTGLASNLLNKRNMDRMNNDTKLISI